MDQLKIALEWLKKHHFWVLLVVLLGASVSTWYLAANQVAADTASNQQKIKAEFTKQQQLQGQPFKPNDEINKRQQQEIERFANGVQETWATLYGRQKDSVLVWPSELGDNFVRYMQNKEFGDNINSRNRERYLNYIQKRFPELLKIIDAEDLGIDGRGSTGGGNAYGASANYASSRAEGGADDLESESEYMVQWLDQASLSSRLNLKQVPTPLEIWVIQEDLWVYETLLRAIAKTNEESGATRRSRAPVRTIEELKVGQAASSGAASATASRIQSPQNDSGIGGGSGERYDTGGGPAFSSSGEDAFRSSGGTGFGTTADSVDIASQILANRYLDPTGQPQTTVPPDYKYVGQFKRLPLRMVLEMDRRRIPELIVQLANAPMQVEVQQLRVNPEDAKRTGTSQTQDGVQAFDRQPTIGRVMLQGIVYIFNKPDQSVFQVSTGL